MYGASSLRSNSQNNQRPRVVHALIDVANVSMAQPLCVPPGGKLALVSEQARNGRTEELSEPAHDAS